VPASRTFLLFDWSVSISAVVAGNVHLGIYDATPTLIRRLFYFTYIAGATQPTPLWGSLFIPIELPTSFSVRLFSSVAALTITGSIHGVEEP
jgi:hypothetical protein